MSRRQPLAAPLNATSACRLAIGADDKFDLEPGLRIRAKTLGERKVQATDQQESKVRLTQFLVELRVAAPSDIDLIGVLRLRATPLLFG